MLNNWIKGNPPTLNLKNSSIKIATHLEGESLGDLNPFSVALISSDNEIAVGPSIRGGGWELLRLGDNVSVDFRAVIDSPKVRFVHANGFVAKTQTEVTLEEALALVERAIPGIVT